MTRVFEPKKMLRSHRNGSDNRLQTENGSNNGWNIYIFIVMASEQGRRHGILSGGNGPTKPTPKIKNSPDLVHCFLKRAAFPFQKVSFPFKREDMSIPGEGGISPRFRRPGGTYPAIPPRWRRPCFWGLICETGLECVVSLFSSPARAARWRLSKSSKNEHLVAFRLVT